MLKKWKASCRALRCLNEWRRRFNRIGTRSQQPPLDDPKAINHCDNTQRSLTWRSGITFCFGDLSEKSIKKPLTPSSKLHHLSKGSTQPREPKKCNLFDLIPGPAIQTSSRRLLGPRNIREFSLRNCREIYSNNQSTFPTKRRHTSKMSVTEGGLNQTP